MARDVAYRHAQQTIESVRRSRNVELDVSCDFDVEDTERLMELPESLEQLMIGARHLIAATSRTRRVKCY